MTWTYEPEELASSPRDVVRLTTGDTIKTRPLMQDEEIDYFLGTVANDPVAASALAANAIAAEFGAKADKTVGRLSISFSRQQEHFENMAKRLRSSGTRGAMPLAGGIGPTYLGSKKNDYRLTDHNIVPQNPSPTFDHSI